MLQQVCEHLNNYFISEIFSGTWTVTNGAISPTPELKEGQRFLISGSDLNDGIYTWHASGIKNDDDATGAGLSDETFYGSISGLAVPPQLIDLAAEISEWVETYGGVITSPFQSEAFGGYSYTRASSKGNATGGSGAAGWEDVFRNRLKRWKKVSIW